MVDIETFRGKKDFVEHVIWNFQNKNPVSYYTSDNKSINIPYNSEVYF